MGDSKVNNGTRRIGWLLVLVAAHLAWGQNPGIQIGDNTHLNAGGLFTFGYSGDYGDYISSDHGVNGGASGTLSGYYYNPNFLSFTATPYYNQSRADSSYQSLTDASGIAGTANFFTGSHFPGSVSYHYDRNSTGTFGLAGQPNFTTVGDGQGFSIGWSALLPGWPTFSVGYSQGSGSGNVYGTNEEATSGTRNLNLRSTYAVAGFRLNGYFDHLSYHSEFPEFLSGEQMSFSETSGHDFGFGANHSLPLNGSFYANYSRSSFDTNSGMQLETNTNSNSFTTSTETAGASFHPTERFGFFVNQSYTGDLSGALTQSLVSGGAAAPVVNLGTNSDSMTFGGGANYQFTRYLNATATATHYQQHFFGENFSGTFVNGTVNYGRRLLNMFTVSASVVNSSNGQGDNALGFIGTVNYFHNYGRWSTSGSFSYAQNVQTLLITYTTSYYQYRANVRRPLWHNLQWTGAFNGNKSGLTQQAGNNNHSEGYSTSLSSRMFSVNAQYNTFNGIGILSSNGIVPVSPTPGLEPTGLIVYNGSSYGGGFSITPVPRLVISGAYARALSDTISSSSPSRNNTEIYNAQLQYHLRRISLLAGYTRFTQGISSSGVLPGSTTSFFVGATRWFDFF